MWQKDTRLLGSAWPEKTKNVFVSFVITLMESKKQATRESLKVTGLKETLDSILKLNITYCNYPSH